MNALATDNIDNNAKILIVEDSVFNQLFLSIMLNNLGYNAIVADNGRKAVELTVANKFDLILMDMEMPILNGLEASVEIKHKNNLNCNTPIILQSAVDSTEILNYGQLFDDKISKPYIKNEIELVIEKYIA